MASTPQPFPSLPAENEKYAEIEADQRRRQTARLRVQAETQQRATVSRQQAAATASEAEKLADRLIAARRRAPWVPASTLMAVIEKAGLDPADPRFEDIAKAAAKKKSKSGWQEIGSIASAGMSAIGRAADTALGGIDEAVQTVARPAVRGAGLVAQSAYEEAQGVVRNVASWDPGGIPVGGAVVGGLTAAALVATAPVSAPTAVAAGAIAGGAALGAVGGSKVEGDARWEFQSTGAIAAGRALAGEEVDLGGGWLHNAEAAEDPDDPTAVWSIADEQRKRATRVNIDGMAVTPGRLLAMGVLQPGSKPAAYLSGLIDGSLALSRFDPASAGLRTAGNVGRNRRLFVEAGELASSRPAISPQAAEAWWDGATDLRRYLTETGGEQGFYDIWSRTNGKLGARLTRQLADATDEAQVDELIRPLLGTELRGPVDAAGFRASGAEQRTRWAHFDSEVGLFKPLQNVRLAKTMPGPTIDLRDADDSVTQIERFLQNAKVDREIIAKHTAAMAGAEGRQGRYVALTSALDATKDVLVKEGWSEDFATQLTRFAGDATEENRGYWINAVGEHMTVEGMYLGADTGMVGVPKPHLYAEYVNRAVPLPNPRDIRAATSMWAPIFKGTGEGGLGWGVRDLGTSTIDFLQGQVWKRLALLRGAYTVRVIAEEQLRMAASGLDSLVNHPLSLIAHRLSDDSFAGRMAQRAGIDVGKAQTDLMGGEWSHAAGPDEMAEVMDEHSRALNREYSMNGWADGMRRPAGRAEFRPGYARYNEAWAGEISKLAHDPVMRETARHLDNLDDLKAQWWGNGADTAAEASTPMQRYRLHMAEEAGGLRSRSVADAYIDSLVERLRYTTGGDSALIDAVATTTLDGAALRHGMKPSKELRDYLGERADIAPPRIMGDKTVADSPGLGQKLDHVTSYLFSNLMAERTNHLSRSPAFRQFYAQRVEELAPWMSDAARADAVGWARTNKLDDVADRLAATTRRADNAVLEAEHADTLAKGYALDNTRDLLYDMNERSQFFDAARIIFPFGEAWKELLGRWARIGIDQPQAGRRAQQVIVGARQADPDGNGQGFFYQDTNGQEVFAYPGSGWVSEKMFGIEVPLTGRVAGLSLMTEVLPGVGPVVQFPASALVPEKPEWQWAQELLFPFGEPDVEGGFAESLLPAWMKKFRDAGWTAFAQDDAAFNSTVMDVMRYLASTGEYDTSTVDGMNELLDESKDRARKVFVLRGAAQFFAPTAPTPEWIVADKNGDALVAQVVLGEYQKLLQDPATRDDATLTMLDRYGEGIFALLQGKTVEVTPSPVSSEGGRWELENADVVKSHPNVFGFFAPQGGELDLATWGRQVDSGRRHRLTPDDAIRLANNRVANAQYQQAKKLIGPNPNEQQLSLLRSLKDALITEYPGYGDTSGVPEKASTATLVRGLQAAAEDERLQGKPTTTALQTYLEARELASEQAQARGLSPTGWQKAKSTSDLRFLLRGLGSVLSAEDAGFASMWERVFDRELAEEEEALDGG